MVTALPLQPGLLNLTGGAFTGIRIAHCEVAGTLLLTMLDGTTTETYDMVEGSDVFIDGFHQVTITSGEFTLAR